MSISGHGLRRLMANSGAPIPDGIGEPYGGGFYFGDITIDGVEYYLIIASRTYESFRQWKTANTATPGTESLVDGLANSNAMNNTDHPAAKYCRDFSGGGFDDWYLPARNELTQAWLNIPPGGAGTPDRFKTGGDQAMEASVYWSSSQHSTHIGRAWFRNLNNGVSDSTAKTGTHPVRPIRRVRK